MGMPSLAATEAALNPTMNGAAKWITSGLKRLNSRSMVKEGVVTTRTEPYPGRPMEATVSTGNPA